MAGNTCSTGMSDKDPATTGADQASCCTTNVMCSTHTCPATHELIANANTMSCSGTTCTNAWCCKCRETVCCGAPSGTVVCGSNQYMDPDKDGVTFTAATAAANCCTAQARCKDTHASFSGTATPTIFLIAAVLYTAAN
jgi:hypothetical protein